MMILADQELIRTVVEDLKYLASDWHERVDDDVLRRGATTIRRLLVENDLQKAWHLSGETEPIIINQAPNLDAFLYDPLPTIAMAGGGSYDGVQACLAIEVNGVNSKEPQANKDIFADQKLTKFLTATSMFFDPAEILRKSGDVVPVDTMLPTRVSRQEVITFVANQLGGSHYGDNDKRPAYDVMREYRRYFNVSGKDAVYFELLSIGQLVGKSPTLQSWVQKWDS